MRQKRTLLLTTFALLTLLLILPATALAADYTGHWAQNSIERALTNGWVRDDGSGTFRPNEPATRAEFVDMINRMMSYTGQADISAYTDVSSAD